MDGFWVGYGIPARLEVSTKRLAGPEVVFFVNDLGCTCRRAVSLRLHRIETQRRNQVKRYDKRHVIGNGKIDKVGKETEEDANIPLHSETSTGPHVQTHPGVDIVDVFKDPRRGPLF